MTSEYLLLMAMVVSDHHVLTVASVTSVTLMSNCDWTIQMKRLLLLLKEKEIINQALTL